MSYIVLVSLCELCNYCELWIDFTNYLNVGWYKTLNVNVIIVHVKYYFISLKIPYEKNTHGGVLLLVACNLTKNNIPPSVFFAFFKLHK